MIRKFTHDEIVLRQISLSNRPRAPLTAILEDIRSLNNVGSVFRTADGAGLEKLWLCGLTGYPPQGGILKASLGAEESVPWEYCASSLEAAWRLKSQGYRIVLLEQAHDSIPIESYVFDQRTCLVIGNEVEGVSSAVCAMADCAVEIGMHGVKNSLNVAVAFGVAVYSLLVKKKFHVDAGL